jgi:hypothetical protein
VLRFTALIVAALAATLCASPLVADDSLEVWPKGGNIRVLEPRALSPDEAEALYDALFDRMTADYAKSGRPYTDYRAWHRLNTAPYLSDQHGARFVDIYVNDKAVDFFTASSDEPLPVGAVAIMDSISAVESGGVSRGPLFAMEKMPPGFAPEFGDWRYSMIMPSGKLFGETGGEGNRAVRFCGECHAQAAGRDHLFDPPEDYLKN